MLPLTDDDRPHLEKAVSHYLAYLRAVDKNTGPFPELLERIQRKQPAAAPAEDASLEQVLNAAKAAGSRRSKK